MITLDAMLHTAINPALLLLPRAMDSDAARVMLLAIGLQESRFTYRFQRTRNPLVHGPALGFWQNEITGVQDVLSNLATRDQALALCSARHIPFDASQVHSCLEHDDVLAAGVARLLLWADPHPVPPVQADHETAWQMYVRCWEPGHPRRDTWDQFHVDARAQVLS